MAYTPGTTFTFTGGYTPGTTFVFADAGSALSASGEGSASFGGGYVASASLSASGEGNAAFVKGGSAFTSIGEGLSAFAGAALVEASLAAFGEGISAFHGIALAESALSASGVGFAVFTGSSIPPVIARQITRTRYSLSLIDNRDITLQTVADWEMLDHTTDWWNGTYWESPYSGYYGAELLQTGIWNVGFRPNVLTVDVDIEHGDDVFSPTVSVGVVDIDDVDILPLADRTVTYGRQSLTYELPIFSVDINRVNIEVTGVNGAGFFRIYGISFTRMNPELTYTLPMSSLSVSSRSGSPSSINAVIPYTVPFSNIIASLATARIEIHRAQTDNTGQTSTALVEYGDVTSIRSDIGGRNASITLAASSTKTNSAVKYVILHGLSYVSVIDGKLRIRCIPSNDLTVGDTVHIDTYTLVANNIQLNVTATLEQMEVYE